MEKERLDLLTMIVPLIGIVTLGILFFVAPTQSQEMLDTVRGFLGNDIGAYYILIGVMAFCTAMYMAFSKFGDVRLGDTDKPIYPAFTWGSLIFTATMAADIIFYSLSEWAMYALEPRVYGMGTMELWAATFPLFHWGPIAWSFYIVLAVAFGFMLHVKGRTRQKFSEACRPILGARVDGPIGKIIDLFAIFALLAGTATTFSLATPLITAAITTVLGIDATVVLTIIILMIIAVVYTAAVLSGMGGIAKLARFSVYLFFTLLLYFLILGGETRFILEVGISSVGNLAQNFIYLATWTDPMRNDSFPQYWTIFYWAYWMAWCIATPFFIGKISKGRTIRNTVLGAYGWGLAGTFTSFIILGNYGLAQQMRHGLDTAGAIAAGTDFSVAIIAIFETLPLPQLALAILALNMVIFYATTFDALTMVVSGYSYKELKADEEPDKKIRSYWSALFIILPIALLFSESSLFHLQSVAIIAAFPIGIIIIIIVAGFFKDASEHLRKINSDKHQ